MKPIWVVDDDQSIRWVLEKALTREQMPCRSFSHATEALAALDEEVPQVLVSDIRMPGKSGLELLQQAKQRHPNLPVIIMTAYSDLDSAVAAFQGGAFEYIPKPFDVDHAVELIRRAVEESERESAAQDEMAEMPEILGQAPALQEVFRAIGRLSQSHVTVLITGESGTGKELVARALHKHSPRANQPFIALNTAAIPKDLLESELFGHERGAFTGAQALRRGRFEQAEGGTLFLDEIGDMPAELQTRLLRVLSDGQFYRVGGHHPIKTNVRVIAATHQNLEDRVKQGLFREDLFHRLNVIRLRLPALRERAEDIPLLAKHFLQKNAQELGVEPKRLTDAAMQVLARVSFPGNVRQLENLCRWITVMAPAQSVDVNDLPMDVRADAGAEIRMDTRPLLTNLNQEIVQQHPASAVEQLAADSQQLITRATAPVFPEIHSRQNHHTWLALLENEARQLLQQYPGEVMDRLSRDFESALIRCALESTRGRRIEAAQKLGIGRNTITRKIQELGLDAPDADDAA